MIAYQYDNKGYFACAIEDYGLLPNNSTRIAPPIQSGFIAQWNGAKWLLVENHMDEEGYVNGRTFTIRDYGPYPAGWSKNAPEPSEREKIDLEIQRIKSRLLELDSESIRPLRAIAENNATEEDTDKLKALDAEAEKLREDLRKLT